MMRARPLGLCGLAAIFAAILMGVTALPALAAPEAPATREAQAITGITAALNGELNPKGKAPEPVEYHFAYAPSEAECDGGLNAPEQPVLATGDPKQHVSVSLTGLEGDTKYAFCLVASAPGEPAEFAQGSTLTFETLAAAPIVESVDSSQVKPTEATVEATVNPENQATTSCVFEYGTTPGYGKKTVCTEPALNGASGTIASANLAGLAGASTYHYRVVVANKTGEVKGPDGKFTTPELSKPTVEFESTPLLAPFEATLEAQINPGYQLTKYAFEYSTTKPTGTKLEGTIVTVSGTNELSSSGAESASVSTGEVLSQNATYYYRAIATNATGSTEGKIEEFKTLAAMVPEVESEGSHRIRPFEATIEAQVNPEYQETSCEFQYGTDASLTTSTSVACSPAELPAGGSTGVEVKLTGLRFSTPYYFRVVLANKTGEKAGPIEELETSAGSPTVEEETATALTPFSEALRAQVNAEYQLTSCELQYGPTAAYGNTVACDPPTLESHEDEPVTVTLQGLQSDSLDHYRFVLHNAAGTTNGSDNIFTTEVTQTPTIEDESALNVSAIDAQLAASVNPNYQSTSYAFEYAEKESTLLEGHGTTVSGGNLAGDSGAQAAGSVDLGSVLRPDTTYYYRVVATNATGTTAGTTTVAHFKTQHAASVGAGETEAVTQTTATVAATVKPEGGEDTSYHVAYIDQAGYEHVIAQVGAGYRRIDSSVNPYVAGGVTGEQELASSDGNAEVVGQMQLIELHADTTYHYALVATNREGTTVIGPDETLTTAPATPPLASTGTAEGVTQLSATLTGAVNTEGLPTTFQFEFGSTPYAGSFVPAGAVSNSGSVTAISTTFHGDLQPGVTYYYRAIATNADGTNAGTELTFTTEPFTVTSVLATAPAVVPYMSIAALDAKEAKEAGTAKGQLTNAQKLAAALKMCRRHKPKRKRSSCEKRARRAYSPTKKNRDE
jgi:phosphodiesterase/alkaline phosphatase D-like protein